MLSFYNVKPQAQAFSVVIQERRFLGTRDQAA